MKNLHIFAMFIGGISAIVQIKQGIQLEGAAPVEPGKVEPEKVPF